MREIKFRAWDKKEKNMYCGNDLFKCGYDDHGLLYDILTNYDNTLTQFELMQFTGLRDKHGKEIYEGDIVNAKTELNNWFKFEVMWDKDYACFTTPSTIDKYVKTPIENYTNFLFQLRELEVIGNIHENPELLKEKKQ